jgi:choice-of-anchor B domain-containing protein
MLWFVALSMALMMCISPALLAHDEDPHGHSGEGPNGQPGNQPLSVMASTPCVNGKAGTFPCSNIDLASFLPLSQIGGGSGNDLWGWTDPLTGREYALMGRSSGTSFVDVTNPEQPVYLGNLPRHSVDSAWRGIKVYGNYAYIVSEAEGHGMQVFDLTQLRNVSAPPVTFTETAHYGGFGRAHTLAINEQTGFAYAAGSRDTCAGGLHMVNLQNPAAPAFAGCVDNDGYTHETQCVVYHGADAAYRGREICFSSNEDTLTIVDVTNKLAPVQLSRTPYEGSAYTHQGWLTDDHKHFLLDDELDERNQGGKTRTYIWNLADLDAPTLSGVYQGTTNAIDHNLYIRGRYAFEGNYRSGLRMLDTQNVSAANLSEVAFFDIFPLDDNTGFNGAWSNYPFFSSGTVLVGGIEQGLFMLRPKISLPVGIDYPLFFVQQHYRDFFSREADPQGQAFWINQLTSCGADVRCFEERRDNTSGAFFLSIEFKETGYLVYRFHQAAFNTGEHLKFNTFMPDTQRIGQGVVVNVGDWQQRLEANKRAFAEEFVARPQFLALYPQSMTAAAFVDALNTNTGGSLSQSERDDLVAKLSNNQLTRAEVLRAVAEDSDFQAREKNRAFVLMEYFGYLRRNPDDAPDGDFVGYNFWLKKLNEHGGDHIRSEMVKAFVTSGEYRRRFGQ